MNWALANEAPMAVSSIQSAHSLTLRKSGSSRPEFRPKGKEGPVQSLASVTRTASTRLRIGEARELVRGACVVSGAARDDLRRRRIAQTLELVSGAAEPARAALDGADLSNASEVETLELVARAAEPARALFDVGVLGSDAEALKLILPAAEPTGAALNHRDRRAALANSRDALTLAVA